MLDPAAVCFATQGRSARKCRTVKPQWMGAKDRLRQRLELSFDYFRASLPTRT
jgi:hypothetical protein